MLADRYFSKDSQIPCKICAAKAFEKDDDSMLSEEAILKDKYGKDDSHRFYSYSILSTHITKRKPLYIAFDFDLETPVEAYACFRHLRNYNMVANYHEAFFGGCLKINVKNDFASTLLYAPRTSFYILLGPEPNNYYEVCKGVVTRVNKTNIHFGLITHHRVIKNKQMFTKTVSEYNKHTCKPKSGKIRYE